MEFCDPYVLKTKLEVAILEVDVKDQGVRSQSSSRSILIFGHEIMFSDRKPKTIHKR
ncbi:hypothetical protein Lepto7375DRAFT_0838 [Leptolyngbya sp. PCC 7375]|nr:hypothetical protein Lepto7375DRAFT_0838 [Leptolyngbya sp. PCC 7375]